MASAEAGGGGGGGGGGPGGGERLIRPHPPRLSEAPIFPAVPATEKQRGGWDWAPGGLPS